MILKRTNPVVNHFVAAPGLCFHEQYIIGPPMLISSNQILRLATEDRLTR